MIAPERFASPPPRHSLFHSAQKRLSRLVSSDSRKSSLFRHPSLFGQRRSRDDVISLVSALRNMGLDSGLIQRGLSHLDIHST